MGCKPLPPMTGRHQSPLPLPQLLRDVSAPVRKFVTKHKVPLGMFSTANLAFIVWQVLSTAQSTREQAGGWEGGCVGGWAAWRGAWLQRAGACSLLVPPAVQPRRLLPRPASPRAALASSAGPAVCGHRLRRAPVGGAAPDLPGLQLCCHHVSEAWLAGQAARAGGRGGVAAGPRAAPPHVTAPSTLLPRPRLQVGAAPACP